MNVLDRDLTRAASEPSDPAAPGRHSVAIISLNGAAVGGVTKVAIGVAQGMPARGWECEVMFPATSDESVLRDWCTASGVNWRWLSGLHPKTSPRKIRDMGALWSVVRTHDAPIVNLHYGGPEISLKDVVAVRLARRRLVVTLHAPTPWSELGTRRRWTTRLASRFVHRIITVTEEVAARLAEAGVARSNVTIIPGGVPIPGTLMAKPEARAALGIPLDAVVVSSIARCAPEKRLEDLVRAGRQVLETEPGINLHVVIKGDDGPGTAELRTFGHDQLGERFHLLGMAGVDNGAVFAASDVFCLPSDAEGYPLVLQEAAAHGLPAISTKVGGIPRLIDDGSTGILFDAHDVDALSRALMELANRPDTRLEMANRARAKAVASFSTERMCDKYLEVFQAVARSRHRATARRRVRAA